MWNGRRFMQGHRPGVYIEEIPGRAHTIKGVSTDIAGFVGQTERGPTDARMVKSWSEFCGVFGEPIDTDISYLPFAVRGFFENGGRRPPRRGRLLAASPSESE